MHEDAERCVRAVRSKDARFDGWFFTAVLTTRIYCRPSCPAVAPRPENMVFYPSAAAAQQAGFRACKRCRPDASPGSPEWNVRADLVARAMRLIADGVIDAGGVPGLAARLGYSVRQLERQLRAELGAGPLALARAQRAQTARLLIETTALPMSDVAFAAGFASIRTFNDTVREVFALSPSQLRERAARRAAQGRRAEPAAGVLALRLPFRAPLVPDSLFGHLAATAVPGVEEWRDGAYRRTLRLPHGPGVVALTPQPDHIACQLSLADLRDLATAISRCRRLLDLDADPVAAADLLRADPVLAPLVGKAPGRRVPRTPDAAEFAVRAVLGQQVSTAAARTHAGRLAAEFGEPVDDPRNVYARVHAPLDFEQALRLLAVRGEIVEELVGIGVLVIASRTLGEALRRDVFAAVETDLDVVLAVDIADVVRRLVEVLDGELRRVAVRTDRDIALIVKLEGGELIQARVGEVARCESVCVPVEPDAELVGQVRCEGVVFG